MFVIISLLLAAACLLPAAGKLTGQPRMRQSAAHFGIPWPRYRLIGVAELAAAAGILIGLWWHPLGLAAAAGMALLLLGAIITTGRQPIARKRWRPPCWPSSSPWPTWPSRSSAEQPARKHHGQFGPKEDLLSERAVVLEPHSCGAQPGGAEG